MWAALESGVRGGKWYSLMDKVCSRSNLRSAFAKVKANEGSPGIDRVTIEMFESRLEDHIGRLVGLAAAREKRSPLRVLSRTGVSGTNATVNGILRQFLLAAGLWWETAKAKNLL
jgi:hypothetical protein